MQREHIAFIRSLTGDMQWALNQLQIQDAEVARRTLVRTAVSGAEGMSWIYRTHVLSIAKEFDLTTPMMEMAFAEASFSVTDTGRIVEQARYVSLPASFRLITNVAKLCCDEVDVDFGCVEWAEFKRTIAIRNRLTHPKSHDDLLLSDNEVEAAKVGYFWLFDMAITVMEQTVEAYRQHVANAKDVIGKLISGDPDTLALYERAHRELDY